MTAVDIVIETLASPVIFIEILLKHFELFNSTVKSGNDWTTRLMTPS